MSAFEGLVMVAPSADKAYGLACCAPGLRVLTAARGETVELLEAVGADVVSVPDTANTSHALVTSAHGAQALRSWAPAPVVLFRPDHRTGEALTGLGTRPVCANPAVARRLENKAAFRALCVEMNLPVVSTVRAKSEDDPALAGMGWPRVVQTARGHAGQRTWAWSQGQSLPVPEKLTRSGVLVAPMLDGPTWTMNAVVRPGGGVVLGDPMRQICGDARLSSNPFASSGAAFNPPAVERVAASLADLTARVGEIAASEGFVGFYGIDAMDGPDGLLLIEMNARLTATMTSATLAERAAGRTPLIMHHVAACLGEELPDPPGDASRGGQVIVRRSSHWPEQSPMAGRYSAESGLRTGKVDGWPGPGEVDIWPAGASHGGPDDRWAQLLCGDCPVDGDGQLVEGIERVLGVYRQPTV